jgi:hypothetical protein
VIKKQIYGKEPYKKAAGEKGAYLDRGVPLVDQMAPSDEALHDRSFGNEKKMAGDRDEYLYWVPEEDPWRQMGQTKFNAGGDARWLFASMESTVGDKKSESWSNFLMAADFAMEFRPIYRNVHLVNETRITGTPSHAVQLEQTINSHVRTRSLYVLVDDLPWNSFVMAGYYRPLFGNQVPDHDALAQRMQAFVLSGSPNAQDLSFNAVTMGTAPNVPYFNLHLIQNRVGDTDDHTQGIGTNFGLRFVTLGLSTNYSYWRTIDDRGEAGLIDVAMHSINSMLMVKRTIVSYEVVSFTRDNDIEDFREGAVHTIETMTKAWKEVYGLFSFAISNTSAEVTDGAATQIKTGVRGFMLPGVESSLTYAYDIDDNTTKKVKTKRTGFNWQIHTYF